MNNIEDKADRAYSIDKTDRTYNIDKGDKEGVIKKIGDAYFKGQNFFIDAKEGHHSFSPRGKTSYISARLLSPFQIVVVHPHVGH